MAISNKKGAVIGGRRMRRQRWKIIGLILLAVMAVTIVYNWPTFKSYSQTGAAYSARVVCSCRYIGGRGLEDCKKDMEPGTEIVSVRDDVAAKRITASVPFLADESAEYRGAFGCVLVPKPKE